MKCGICPLACDLDKDKELGLCRIISFSEEGVLKSRNSGILEYGMSGIEDLGFYHYYPGYEALYVVMPGCNLRCTFCPEWKIVYKNLDELCGFLTPILPKNLVKIAKLHHVKSIIFSCNSALNSEYIKEVYLHGKGEGLSIGLITHGVFCKEYINHLLNYLDAILVIFLGFSERSYSKITIIPTGYKYALEIAKLARSKNKHLEIAYIVITGINDSKEEIENFLNQISAQITNEVPIHFKRFQPNFILTEKAPTRTKTLKGAWILAKKKGFKYVYIDDIFEGEPRNTVCPVDNEPIILRIGSFVFSRVNSQKGCPRCGKETPFYGDINLVDESLYLKFRVVS